MGRYLVDEERYQFFVKNHLGSTMRVVEGDGSFYTSPVFDYQAYGERQEMRPDTVATPGHGFTGKEFDSGVNLYYFGARWYDPELGLWTGPDPAGEFFNPYSYVGGSPLAFVDPEGLWSIGLGIVVGYNRRQGWHVGFGAAAYDIDLGVVEFNTNVSHVWNEKGGQTSTAAVGGGVQLGIVGVDGQVGYSHDSRYGHNFNAKAGANIIAVGAETGTNHSWSKDGDYLGGNVYGEAYLGAKGAAHYGGGYELGWGGYASGWYGSASFLQNQYSNRGGGWRYEGFEHRVGLASYQSKGSRSRAELVTARDIIGHSAITGEYKGEEFKISWGPGSSPENNLGFFVEMLAGSNDYEVYGNAMSLRGVSVRRLYQYSRFLDKFQGSLGYNLLVSSCVTHTSFALAYAGAMNVGIHPVLLESQMRLRNGRAY